RKQKLKSFFPSSLSLISLVMATVKTVKDVSPHKFVKSYASHIKRLGKSSQVNACFLKKGMYFEVGLVKSLNFWGVPSEEDLLFVLLTDLVKTDVLKELAPYDPDWYYIRAASMARKI
ncbi:40S ribosomal protein S19, partial [Striga asiatica]